MPADSLLFFHRSYSPLSPTSQPISPDELDPSRSGSPNLEFPRIDLMNEMKDLLQLRLDTPPVDRSVSIFYSLSVVGFATFMCVYTVPKFIIALVVRPPRIYHPLGLSSRPFFRLPFHSKLKCSATFCHVVYQTRSLGFPLGYSNHSYCRFRSFRSFF